MSAPAILQSYLDAVSTAVMADDWDGYRPRVLLPLHIVSHQGNSVITFQAELRQGYDQFRETLRFHRVTDYIRLVEQAGLLEDNMISGSYLTHLISNGHRLLEPFRTQITLRRVDGGWRGASFTNGLAFSRWSLAGKTSAEF